MLNATIYRSRIRRALNEQELNELISVSNKTNKRLGLSGFLCRTENYYVQYLEGEDLALNLVLKKILKDDRHFDIIIEEVPIDTRRCTDWGMVQVSGLLEGGITFAHLMADILGRSKSVEKLELNKNIINLVEKQIELSSLDSSY